MLKFLNNLINKNKYFIWSSYGGNIMIEGFDMIVNLYEKMEKSALKASYTSLGKSKIYGELFFPKPGGIFFNLDGTISVIEEIKFENEEEFLKLSFDKTKILYKNQENLIEDDFESFKRKHSQLHDSSLFITDNKKVYKSHALVKNNLYTDDLKGFQLLQMIGSVGCGKTCNLEKLYPNFTYVIKNNLNEYSDFQNYSILEKETDEEIIELLLDIKDLIEVNLKPIRTIVIDRIKINDELINKINEIFKPIPYDLNIIIAKIM